MLNSEVEPPNERPSRRGKRRSKGKVSSRDGIAKGAQEDKEYGKLLWGIECFRKLHVAFLKEIHSLRSVMNSLEGLRAYERGCTYNSS